MAHPDVAVAEEIGVQSITEALPAGVALVRQEAAAVALASPAEIASYARQFDEEAFTAELMGEAAEKWFYEFDIQGKKVEGVSTVGASEFARIRAEQGYPIRFPNGGTFVEEITYHGDLGIRAQVTARDVRTGAEGIGMAFYPWYVTRTRKNGDVVTILDDKADRKALAVAQRNAILELVPVALILMLLRERRTLIAANDQRRAQEIKAATAKVIGSRKPPRSVTAAEHRQEQQATDPYEQAQAAVQTPQCPKCGSETMYDNRAENAKRRATGQKERPDWKCKDASCDGVIWPPKGDQLPLGDAPRGKGSTRIQD